MFHNGVSSSFHSLFIHTFTRSEWWNRGLVSPCWVSRPLEKDHIVTLSVLGMPGQVTSNSQVTWWYEWDIDTCYKLYDFFWSSIFNFKDSTLPIGLYVYIYIHIYLVGGWPTLWKICSSVGMILPNIWKVIKFMFQTTKQCILWPEDIYHSF